MIDIKQTLIEGALKKLDIKQTLIEEALKKLPAGWIVLLETNAEKALEVSLAAVKALTDQDYHAIIISANRPYLNLSRLYTASGIDASKIFVIDCISKTQTPLLETSANVTYLDGVSYLTDISIAITEAIAKVQGTKFIFIDSVTTMLIHNPPDVFTRFIHYTLTKLRVNEVSGLLISLEDGTDREIRAEIAQLCDKVIKI
jgi:hypothetical protein